MKIYKYPLEVQYQQDVLLPGGAKILTIQMQRKTLQLWALVKETAPHLLHTILLIQTGDLLPKQQGAYINTFQMQQGGRVFHAFVLKTA